MTMRNMIITEFVLGGVLIAIAVLDDGPVLSSLLLWLGFISVLAGLVLLGVHALGRDVQELAERYPWMVRFWVLPVMLVAAVAALVLSYTVPDGPVEVVLRGAGLGLVLLMALMPRWVGRAGEVEAR